MRGSIKNQVATVFHTILQIGESKHEAKELAREKIESDGKIANWHNVGKQIGVYSYNTYTEYFNTARDLMQFVKENYNVKDITKITREQVNSFLQNKIDQNLSRLTLQKYISALEKLEVAVNTWLEQNQKDHEKVNFDLQQSREIAKATLEKADQHRAYSDPKALIENIKDNTFQVIAQAQLEGGARIREINHLKLSQFDDLNQLIEIRGKGGYKREIKLSNETYNQLKQLVINSENNKFVFSENRYRDALKEAAKTSGQIYTGSHGLRWSFAQNKMLELQIKENYSYDAARATVSSLLGHHRIDITDHYLQ